MAYRAQYTNARAERTHLALQSAFRAMVLTMDCNDISVAAITARAGVSRKTFYQYYAWREDIFVEACDDVVRRYTASMAAAEEDATQDSVAFYRRFFEFFAKEERYVERILCDPSYSVYRARIVAGCAASNRRHQDAFEKMTEEESSLFQDYLMYNLFSLFTHWIDQGRSASLEHLIHFAFKMSDRGVSWLRPREE